MRWLPNNVRHTVIHGVSEVWSSRRTNALAHNSVIDAIGDPLQHTTLRYLLDSVRCSVIILLE
jgi:hypothetical protein